MLRTYKPSELDEIGSGVDSPLEIILLGFLLGSGGLFD